MNRDRWRRLNEIFNQASSLHIDEREAFLKTTCGTDGQLLREVNGLLERADSVTDDLLLGPAELNARECFPKGPPKDPLLGMCIGPYQLDERIGHGGFATVYLASRTVGFEQEVAVKMLREDQEFGETVMRRFEIERQILSDLQHENIARLLDGGRTESGRPYFVMEYVKGRPITEYCDENRLDVTKRLEVFQKVGSAVAHAHQYGIIHRDVKPGNILVTDQGHPKLVDFGIAKLTDVPPGERSPALTLTGQLPLTPEYASPEQVRGEAVGLASDVYSLGVVLHELLAGCRPDGFDASVPHEIKRVVCHREPAKPSTLVFQKQLVETARDGSVAETKDAKTISSARSTEPDRLRRLLRGDLDNIVLMALRKEPQRRYASAKQLADDIQCYFNGLPVVAREESVKYRMNRNSLRCAD